MSKTVKEVLLENKAVLGERITEKNFYTLREGDFLFGIRTFQNPQKAEEDLGVRDYGNRFVAEDVEPGSDLVLCLYMTKKYNVINSWISCAYVGGPHGWCHPDGTIGYSDNVGKWPSVEEVFEEWKMLAEVFPFIEVEATLMDREYCEEDPQPVVSFLIRNGDVTLVDPAERNLHEEFGRTIPCSSDHIETMLKNLLDVRGEHAISLEQIKKWGEEVWKGEKDV